MYLGMSGRDIGMGLDPTAPESRTADVCVCPAETILIASNMGSAANVGSDINISGCAAFDESTYSR
jgi:hypothetical protein